MKTSLHKKFAAVSLLLFWLAACQQQPPQVIPTRAQPEAVATSIHLTENAPPPGFDTVSFPRIDGNTEALSGWRYEMIFAFNGVFARTPRETAVQTSATITYNQVGTARRVIAQIDNDLEAPGDPLQLEAVRRGEEVYLVREGNCILNATEDAQLLADLSAGDLLGGVQRATTAAEIATINGEQVWRYDFTMDNLLLPNVGFREDTVILDLRQELWVSPEHNAVVRFYVTMEAENITVFGSTLPVSGAVLLRYDLHEIGTMPNISIPFGC